MDAEVPLSAEEIKQILDVIEASGWDEARITVGESTLVVSKAGGTGRGFAVETPAVETPAVERAQAPQTALAEQLPEPTPAPGIAPSGHVITSPTVGVFWRAPEPGAPPFVELGAHVEPGTNLCIVEVMKLMNYVTTDVAGMIAAIHVGNGEPVAKGTPLFSIDAASSGA